MPPSGAEHCLVDRAHAARGAGQLTTKKIADAFLVPEATMARRIRRAKRTLARQSLAQPADIAVGLRVLYLIFNEEYTGRSNLAAGATA